MVNMAIGLVDLSHAIMLAEFSDLMRRESLVGFLDSFFVVRALARKVQVVVLSEL